jgi:hypothetical protein
MSRSRQRVPLEAGQKLDINQLRRAGHMPRDLQGASAGSILVEYPAIGFSQEIRFTSRPRHYGGRQFYFECPVTGRRCSVLWRFGAGRFACRQAWRGQVAYTSQFAEPSARCHMAKDRIRRRLGGPDWWDDMPPKPKRMRKATYARWEARYELQERMLDTLLLRLFSTKWAHLKDIV